MKGLRLEVKDGKLNLTETVIGPESSNKIEKHLCWDSCQKAYPFKCDKVSDLPKKGIDKYPFIKEGYQIYDENGKLRKFIVKKCSNYEREKEQLLDKEKSKRLRKFLNN